MTMSSPPVRMNCLTFTDVYPVPGSALLEIFTLFSEIGELRFEFMQLPTDQDAVTLWFPGISRPLLLSSLNFECCAERIVLDILSVFPSIIDLSHLIHFGLDLPKVHHAYRFLKECGDSLQSLSLDVWCTGSEHIEIDRTLLILSGCPQLSDIHITMPLYVQLDRFLYSKLSLETAVSILTQSHIPKLSRIHLKLQAYDYSGDYLCYDELAVLTYLEQLDWGIFNQVIDSPSLPSKNSLVLEARGATLLISVMRGSAGHYGKGLGESLREIVKERLPLRAYAAVEII